MWLFRIISSSVFLLSIILSIPLAFDVGGRECGLAYSLSLFYFYFFFSVLKLATPDNSRGRWALGHLISMVQWIVLPGLLIWSMNRFAVDAAEGSWVEKTFNGRTAEFKGVKDWIFGAGGVMEMLTIGTWDKVLRYSTPLFQLAEGFCSLLVIQAAGQITRWLVNRGGRSDAWMISLLVLSASIISSSIYFLYKITQFPQISNIDASLIGVTVTCAVILCAWGIGSGRGNPVESSLLFAYVVLCIYQIHTDYLPSTPETQPPPPAQPEFPPFPPIIMASYSTLVHVLSTLPTAIHSSISFFLAAFQTITASVIISLAYRLFVFYAATRIIPAVRESGARALSQEPSLDDDDGAGKILGLLSWFSPSILIAVYTSLLMQHFANAGSDEGGGASWTLQGGSMGGNWNWIRWLNVGGTMALYALELYLGKEDLDGGVTNHWKMD